MPPRAISRSMSKPGTLSSRPDRLQQPQTAFDLLDVGRQVGRNRVAAFAGLLSDGKVVGLKPGREQFLGRIGRGRVHGFKARLVGGVLGPPGQWLHGATGARPPATGSGGRRSPHSSAGRDDARERRFGNAPASGQAPEANFAPGAATRGTWRQARRPGPWSVDHCLANLPSWALSDIRGYFLSFRAAVPGFKNCTLAPSARV